MSEKQRTVKGIVKVNGIGLHTGLEVNLEIHLHQIITATNFSVLTWRVSQL